MSEFGAFIVSGAGSGIGRAIAREICVRGHHVFGLGRDPKKLEATGRLLGPQFSSASVDLGRADESSRTIQEIQRWLKAKSLPLLGLVNNAGIFDRVPFTKTSDEIWQRYFDTNLLSAVRLTRDVYPELKAAGPPASVLNISSRLALRPVGDTSVYSAIKAAMNSWTQTLALEWAPDGIRVNAICPGMVDTPIHDFFGEPDHASEARRRAHALQPLGTMGTPDDVAHAAWFLLSPESRWTTGAILSVDGGSHV